MYCGYVFILPCPSLHLGHTYQVAQTGGFSLQDALT
jgi:hypothetical protein